MRKVLLDINVVLDFFLERKPFFHEVRALFAAVEQGKIEGYLCASSLDTIYYLVQKAHNARKAREVTAKLLKLFGIADVNREVLLEALAIGGDFEDNIVLASARLKGLDLIVTRDKTGFAASDIPIVTPALIYAMLLGL